MAITFLGNIDSLKGLNTGFFIKETLNKYGDNLYNTYKNSSPVQFNSSSQTLNGVKFSSSDYSKFYYGTYKSSISRWPYIINYFTIFYRYDGSNPSIKVYFPKAFTDINYKTRDLEIDVKVLDVVQLGDESISGKLIPILGFESRLALQNYEVYADHPEWYPPATTDNPPSPNEFYGWVYPYLIKSTTDPSNVMGDYFGVRTKSTYTLSNPAQGTKIPMFVLDMDLYQANMQENAAGYAANFSESCMIPEAVSTNFYTGNRYSTTAPYIQYIIYEENLTDPEDSSKKVTRFHGKTGVKDTYGPPPKLTGSDYELSCGIALVADNASSIYNAGSLGVSRLFPNLSAEVTTINFIVNSSAGETCDISKSVVYTGSSYGSGSGGWPDAEKLGHTFDGWYTSSSGGTKINPSDLVTSSTTVNLYAHFTPISYTLIYEADGATVQTVSYTINTNLNIRDEYSKPGYTFNNWKVTSANGSWILNSTYNKNANVGTGNYGDVTLTAQYSMKPISLESFNPKPGDPSSDNDYFGVPIDDLDPNLTYTLTLSVEGDRQEKSPFTLGENQGSWVNVAPFSWTNTIENVTKSKLDSAIYFPMDVWRCRIHHPDAIVKVTLTASNGSSTSVVTKDNSFEIASAYKPQLSSVNYYEGVKVIDDLELSALNKRYIGNKKSCVLCEVISSNKDSSNREMLYEAVPRQFSIKLDRGSGNTSRTDANWESSISTITLTAAEVQDFINMYVGGDQKMEYTTPKLEVADDPFPDIKTDLINARLRIKVLDTRHSN